MMKRLMAIGIIIMGAIMLPTSTHAQAICGIGKDIVIKNLKNVHNEDLVWQGLTSGDNILEIYASPKGSWTIFIVDPKGCLYPLASGDEIITPFTPPGEPA